MKPTEKKAKTTLTQVSDAERAVYDLQRIRKEIDGLIAYYASRMPERTKRGPAVVIDPRTGEEFKAGQRGRGGAA
jgi:hypothetical protein